jgi:putative tryptophan/tyrosine transport system substrate-binding protein
MRHAGRMLGRRVLVRGLVGILLAAPRRAGAQPGSKSRRIGVLRPAPDDARFQRDFDGFRDALREGGYVEGTNLAIEYRMRPGPPDAILGLAAELVQRPVDVIAAISPVAVAAAAKATRTIPIVAVDLETDPLASGLVTSLARPGGNVTGLFLDFPELAGKWLEMMREAVPSLVRVAVLWDPATGPAQMKAAEVAARTLRLQIQVLPARAAADLDAAVRAAVKGRAGALMVLSSPVFNASRREVATLTARSRLPSIMAFPGYAEDGGLIGYGPHLRSMFEQAGRHVVRVLKGAPPREIPVERPSRFSLLINQTTARALGVTIPPSLLARADEVIQR